MENYQQRRKNRYLNFFLNIYALYNEKVSLRKFVELLLTLGTIVIFSVFAIKPTLVTIIGLVKEIDEKEKTITLLDQKIDNLRVGQSEYSQLIDFTTVIDSALADQAPTGNFVKYMEKYTTQNNLTSTILKTGKINWQGNTQVNAIGTSTDKKIAENAYVLDEKLDSFSGVVGFQGSYNDCVNFIKTISSVRIPMLLDKISLVKGENDLISGTIDVRIPYLQGVSLP